MRRAAKVDANQSEIVDAFRKLGCSVLSLAPMGKGVPDLIVAKGGRTVLVEVKGPKGKLTPDQVSFNHTWRGWIGIARGMDDVQQIAGML